MTKESSPRRMGGIFTVVGVIFGLAVLLLGVQIAKLAAVRQTWPTATGMVVSKSQRGWWDEERQRRYYLKYRYQVAGKSYTNTQVHLKEESLKKLRPLLRHYSKGDALRVWYNPRAPEESVINVDYPSTPFALVVVLFAFIVLAGTMRIKERRWQRQLDQLVANLPANYDGKQRLPSSEILVDQGSVIWLETGMSVFWRFGVPFLGISFLTLLGWMFLVAEINPGWSLLHYLAAVAACWGISLIGGCLFSRGFKHSLEVDAGRRRIQERSTTFFKQRTRGYDFAEVTALKSSREAWQASNTQRNWMLHLETRPGRALFVCYKHRDLQPADGRYLELVKRRLEAVIFQEQTT